MKGRQPLNPFHFVTICMAKYPHLTITVVSHDRFEQFKCLFTSRFDADYTDLFQLNIRLTPIQLLAMLKCVKNQT